jgi:hypothetical protein
MAFLVVCTAALYLVNPSSGDGQAPVPEKQAPPTHRLTRVSDPAANGAVEVSVAINPTNPDHMVGVSIASMKGFPGIGDFAYVTTDAGRNWKTVPRANPQKRRQGDDVVTFTADGLAVHAYIAFDGIRMPRPKRADTGILTSTSRDGLTWSDAVAVVDHVNTVEPYEDKPWIKADVSNDSPNKGSLYIAWTKFDVYGSKNPEHKTHVYFSRSIDAGKSFSVPWRISDVPGNAEDKSDSVMGAVPAVGPKGEVYVVWAGPKALFFTKSTTAGYTFGKTKAIADCAGWDFPIKGLGRADGLASMGVDVSKGKDRGSVYVCWGDTRNGDPDVFLIVSRDGGETWTQPQRVNNDPLGNGKEQWFPWVAVDPVDGAVNIAYYDRGAQPETMADVTLARSVDGGRTFVYHKVNKDAYDLSKLGFFGDYLGIDSFGGRVAVLYMHPMDATKKLGISSGIFDFEPGTQRLKMEKATGEK